MSSPKPLIVLDGPSRGEYPAFEFPFDWRERKRPLATVSGLTCEPNFFLVVDEDDSAILAIQADPEAYLPQIGFRTVLMREDNVPTLLGSDIQPEPQVALGFEFGDGEGRLTHVNLRIPQGITVEELGRLLVEAGQKLIPVPEKQEAPQQEGAVSGAQKLGSGFVANQPPNTASLEEPLPDASIPLENLEPPDHAVEPAGSPSLTDADFPNGLPLLPDPVNLPADEAVRPPGV